jgi:transposase, IS5 family
MRQAGLFGLSDHLKRLSAHGDPLEELSRIIDFETFRPVLVAALAYGDGAKGGRPPYDPVAMLKVLILAAQNNVSDARMEYLGTSINLSLSPCGHSEGRFDSVWFPF